MKLTKEERRAVLRAAKMIDDSEQLYCCAALAVATGDLNYNHHRNPLADKFRKFFGLEDAIQVFPIGFSDRAREIRVLALLSFLEANK